ncbi:MAG: lysophospholipid acyltransferase family protein, partial [Pseudomonadota bacterium]
HGRGLTARLAAITLPIGSNSLKSFLRWPYQLYVWLILFPVSALWSLLCGWLAVVTALLVSPRFASTRIGGMWARFIGRLTPMLVTVEGSEHIDPSETYVVVCNHASQYDILLVYGWLGLDLRWVMKKELRNIPGIGIGCEKVGHILVDRSKPEEAKQIINDALADIGDGVGVLFFPEGTRSLDGRLLPFKKGAFRIAVDQGLPVLPLTLLGTHEIMPSKSLFITPGPATLVIHPPIEPGDRSAVEVTRAARDAIASRLPEATA